MWYQSEIFVLDQEGVGSNLLLLLLDLRVLQMNAILLVLV